ncbi:MAG: site-specific integrase, partial [Actinomycetota bacterium]|nr:site-specific integrase [Actinomycetota bacterium]
MSAAAVMAGSARLVLVDGAILLHPEAAMFEAILAGWRLQQESRLLAAPTVDSRDKTLRRFQDFTASYPWQWGPADIEEWSVSLRSAGRSPTTVRAYQNAVAMFCDFACDGRYGWAVECEERFGEHPSQICHDWNTADHVADYEGDPARRPFTRDELQGFFDFADDRVAAARSHGRKGGLAAWRDTALFKV